MMSTAPRAVKEFRHEALLYAGEQEFVHSTASFIRGGVAADEPVLVVLAATKIGCLRDELGRDAEQVQFEDMVEVGTNPARILPAWFDFVGDRGAGGRRVRGIGEPIWAGRSSAELIESQRHESLLNLAFAGAAAMWLLCPYDIDALDPTVVDEARRSHPYLAEDGAHRPSPHFVGVEDPAVRFDEPLPEPGSVPSALTFDVGSFEPLRKLVADRAHAAGLDRRRGEDLLVAVNELASNSVLHGGGGGVLRVWRDGSSLICEVRDDGRIDDPLAGRRRPQPTGEGGRGLWLVNQLCDLVQVRAAAGVVRVHMRV